MSDDDLIADIIAAAFHSTYERLAPDYGYLTRESSRRAWGEVPENNRALMRATVRSLLDAGIISAGGGVIARSESTRTEAAVSTTQQPCPKCGFPHAWCDPTDECKPSHSFADFERRPVADERDWCPECGAGADGCLCGFAKAFNAAEEHKRDLIDRLRFENEALRERMDDARGHLSRLESDLSSLYWNAEGDGPQEPPEHLTEAIEAAQTALQVGKVD